jgi:hypothetical protein
MAESRNKRFGKGRSDAKIRILPVEESPRTHAGQTAGDETAGLSDVEESVIGSDGQLLGKHLGHRMAQHLKDHPEQVKRLFSSWLEEEEN